jgi:Multiple myeloma tumor-associated
MDLLSSIRKEGSRGGVDFKWSDVETSQHRENYLGHSLMAPVGRWQKNKDLSWYAKPDSNSKVLNKDGKEETDAEKKARERKEEIRRVKEADEDALVKALGLPVPERNGPGTGANNIDVGEMKRVIKETEAGDDEIDEVGRGRGFGDFVGKVGIDGPDDTETLPNNMVRGGLVEKDDKRKKVSRPARGEDKSRSRSQSRDRRHRRHRHRDRSRDGAERHRHRRHEDRRKERRESADRPRERRDKSPNLSRLERRRRSRSPERHRERRDRSRSHSPLRRDRRDRSTDQYRPRRDDRDRRRGPETWSRRSRSPGPRERNRERDGDRERWR